jgi:hypothetical protein
MRVRSVALLTTVSIPLVVAYDLWTAVGEWYFLTRPLGIDMVTVLELQVPFTLYHILGTLIFVPLFGALFLYLRGVLLGDLAPTPGDAPTPHGRDA